MNPETQTIEYKSLQKIRTGDKGFRELSTTCVALANAQGGKIYIGYDDKKKHTLPGQVIEAKEINDAIRLLLSKGYKISRPLGLDVKALLADHPELESKYMRYANI